MDQNTIALIWDFDKTLINGYMQEPLFKKYGIDTSKFWEEVNRLPEEYREKGIKVNPDTIYLNHILTCISQGMFKGLTNKILTDMGKELNFYEGAINFFKATKDELLIHSNYSRYGIHIENYIISTGLSATIRGTEINEYVKGIWGCEFIEDPIPSKLSANKPTKTSDSHINQIGYIIDNTSKTRAVFEINKGVNLHDYIDVNSKIDDKNRRVPFKNMIYIADGPSDVPVFSILKRYGGKTFAVYPKGDQKAFNQVDQLRSDGRIDMYAEADYTKGSAAYMWLTSQITKIADSIFQENEDTLRKAVGNAPKHLV